MKTTCVRKSLVLASLLASTPIFAKTVQVPSSYWDSYLSIGGYYFSERPSAAGVINAFLPLPKAQSPSSLYYLNIRGLDKSGPSWEGNLGLGYRKLNTVKQSLYGMYAFYDRQRSENRHYFTQITLGGEYWQQQWFVGGNIYIPVGKTAIDDASFNTTTMQTNGAYRNIYYGKGQDVAYPGIDLEVGYEWRPGIIGYFGGYYFDRSGFPSVKGPLARIEYRYKDHMGKKLLGALDDLRLFTQIQHDEPRGTRLYVGAQVRVTLGRGHKPLHGIARHMLDPALRDVDLVSVPTHKALKPLTDSTGKVINVRDVHNLAELDIALADIDANIIAVHGTIVEDDAKILATGQAITGGRHVFEAEGQIFTAKLSGGGTLDAVDAETDVLNLTTNNTVRDLTLRAYSDSDIDIIESADSSVSLGQLTIDGIVGNAFIYLEQDDVPNAVITITNNTIDMGTTDGGGYGVVSIDADEASITAFINNNVLKSQGDDTLGIQLISTGGGEIDLPNGLHNNTIDVNNEGVYIYSDDDASIVIDGFHDNTIDCSHEGVDIYSTGNGKITIDELRNNTIDTDESIGIAISSDNNGSVTIDGLHDNTIDANNEGVYIYSDDASITIDGFHDNTINATSYGVYIDSYSDGSITIDRFYDNVINAEQAILLSGEDASIMIAGFYGNTLTATSDYTMVVEADDDATINIMKFYGNTFEGSDLSDVYLHTDEEIEEGGITIFVAHPDDPLSESISLSQANTGTGEGGELSVLIDGENIEITPEQD